jgi:DNA-binding response OmpR family regulator
MAKILVIEDDKNLAHELCNWLTQEYHSVEHVVTGDDGLYRLRTYSYDIAIVDWNLPDIEGVEICRQIRAVSPFFPLLMLTSRDDIKDKISGLDKGATDYMVKPPSFPELSARIRSIIRREGESISDTIVFGDLEIDSRSRSLAVDGVPVRLSAGQYDLLLFFLRKQKEIVPLEVLLSTFWSEADAEARNNFKAQLNKLRQRLTQSGSQITIEFIAGRGYQLKDSSSADN